MSTSTSRKLCLNSLYDYIFEQALTALSETKQKSLEEIAAAFGDQVVEISEHDITVEGEVFDAKAAVSYVKRDH